MIYIYIFTYIYIIHIYIYIYILCIYIYIYIYYREREGEQRYPLVMPQMPKRSASTHPSTEAWPWPPGISCPFPSSTLWRHRLAAMRAWSAAAARTANWELVDVLMKSFSWAFWKA